MNENEENRMEIERKFLLKELPASLEKYPCRTIEQGYLTTNPVVRVRRDEQDYYMTYKGSGLLAREEYNLPLTKEAYDSLLTKCEGNIISKKRYLIPIDGSDLTIELDVFAPPFAPLIMAEVEFKSMEEANAFCPPSWFGEDVTKNPAYHNSNMAMRDFKV